MNKFTAILWFSALMLWGTEKTNPALLSSKEFGHFADRQIKHYEDNLLKPGMLIKALQYRLKQGKATSKVTLIKSVDAILGYELQQLAMNQKMKTSTFFESKQAKNLLAADWCDYVIELIEKQILPDYGTLDDLNSIMNLYLFQIYRAKGSAEDIKKANKYLAVASNKGKLEFLRRRDKYIRSAIQSLEVDTKLSTIVKIKKLCNLYILLDFRGAITPKQSALDTEYAQAVSAHNSSINSTASHLRKLITELATRNDLKNSPELKGYIPESFYTYIETEVEY